MTPPIARFLEPTPPRPSQHARRARSGRATGQQRRAAGKAARAHLPLASHAEIGTPARDPVLLLEEQAATRVPELVPIRYGRMLADPFTFLRGAARVMAVDLGSTPQSGLYTHLCGDAHLSNFGFYTTPERQQAFDINDFDETHPGPFEWDVKRLAASVATAGLVNGLSRGRHARPRSRQWRNTDARFAGWPTWATSTCGIRIRTSPRCSTRYAAGQAVPPPSNSTRT